MLIGSNWCNLNSHDTQGGPTFVKNKTYMWHDRAGNALEGRRVSLGHRNILRLWMPFKVPDQNSLDIMVSRIFLGRGRLCCERGLQQPALYIWAVGTFVSRVKVKVKVSRDRPRWP